ncbi:MAG: flagellar hook-length control protein FliK [Oscillospiraceae bacterium]
MTNIAVLGGALSAMTAGTGSAVSDFSGVSDGGSFKGILGGLMSTPTDSSADISAAEVFSPETLSSDSVTAEIMSESTETALKYLVGSYLQSAMKSAESEKSGNTDLFDFLFTEGTDSEDTDYTDIWQQLFDSLTSSDITQISSFSAELSTALFGGGKNDEKSSGDVLAGLFENIDMSRMKVKSDTKYDDATLSALAAGGIFSFVSFADVSPENEGEKQLDTQLAALIGAADDETIGQLAQELAEAVSAAAENAAETTGFSEEIVTVKPENAQTSSQAAPPEMQTADMGEDIFQNVTFISFASKVNVRSADISEEDGAVIENSERVLPKIGSGSDEINDEAAAAQLGQNTRSSEVQLPEMTESVPEETQFKTMEQIIEKLEEQADGFTESKELVIRLTPETLGEITVKIEKAADGAVSVTFAAQNRDVNELIADRSAQLAQALSDKGTEVSSINVVEPAQSGQNLAFDMSGGQNAFNFRQQGMGEHHRTDGTRFDSEEEDELTVGGVSQSTDADYIAKEAKLWKII